MSSCSVINETIKVMIVDDHPAMREGIGMWINRQPDMCVCCDAGDAITAMNLIGNNCPDVVVLDDTNQMVTLPRLILFRYLF